MLNRTRSDPEILLALFFCVLFHRYAVQCVVHGRKAEMLSRVVAVQPKQDARGEVDSSQILMCACKIGLHSESSFGARVDLTLQSSTEAD